jgi:DNA-binding PadR family transcriptional regulator
MDTTNKTPRLTPDQLARFQADARRLAEECDAERHDGDPRGRRPIGASAAPLSLPLRNALGRVALGRAAQIAAASMPESVLTGMLAERGLVRTVRHRDHTRSYALTEAGRAALRPIGAMADSSTLCEFSICKCGMTVGACQRQLGAHERILSLREDGPARNEALKEESDRRFRASSEPDRGLDQSIMDPLI